MSREDMVVDIEIASIVPTVYEAKIEAIGEDQANWDVPKKDCVSCAIKRQMNELANMWAEFTKSRLKLRHQTYFSEVPVRRLQRKDGCIEITAPSPKKAHVPLAMTATFWFFWIVCRDDIAERLKKVECKPFSAHARKRKAWLPWKYSDLLNRTGFRSGINHEFRHCLVHLMRQAGVDSEVLPTPQEERKDKHGPFFRSRYLAGVLLARDDNSARVSAQLDNWRTVRK